MTTLFDLQPNIVKSSPDIVSPVATPLTFLPSVPSNVSLGNPVNTNTKLDTANKTVDKGNLIDYYLKQANGNNAPEYLYGTKEETRYDNPYLQFTPKVQGAYDTEDAYAKYQGTGERLLNAVVKTGATAGATFISTFSDIPNQIDAIRKGEASKMFEETSTFGSTQRWLHGMEDKFPNYYSQWERDHPYLSAIPFYGTGGAMNFWGDKILKNAGFTIGGLAAALVTDTAIELATEGLATPATLILAGKQISNAIKPLKNLFRGLSKASVLGKVEEVSGLAQTSKNLVTGIKAANSTYNIKKAGQFALTLYSSSQGEAMIEGYNTYVDTKTKLLQESVDQGKQLTPELISGIEQSAGSAGKVDMLINLALLSAGNLIQFPKIVGWAGKSDILKKLDTPFLDIVKKEGLEVVNNWSRKQAVKNIIKGSLLHGILPEGFEEGSQYYVGNSLHDYYIDKFNGKAKKGMLDYMVNAIPKTLDDPQFWQESILGALSGGIMGRVLPGGEIKHIIKTNSNEYNERYKSTIQKTLDTFNNSVKDLTHLGEIVEHGETGTSTEKFQTAYKALFSTVRDAAKYGVLDSLKENLKELETLPVEEYNKLFYTDSLNNPESLRSETAKLAALKKINNEVGNIENDLIQIEKFFPTNPFTTDKVAQRIMTKFKVDKSQIGNVQEKLFDDFKENTAYQMSRLRNTVGRITDIKNELRLGVPITDENFGQTYAVLTNLTDEKAVKQYLRFKDIQIGALKDQEDYYRQIGDNQSAVELKRNSDRINQLKEKLVDAKFETKDQQDSVSNLILEEEMGVGQARVVRIMEQLQEAREQEQIANNTEAEIQTAQDTPEVIAEAQIDVVAEMEQPVDEQVEPKEEPAESTPPKPNRIAFGKVLAFNEGETFVLPESPLRAKEFTVLSKNDSQVIVRGDNDKDYIFSPFNIREINSQDGEGSVVYYESFFDFSPTLKGKAIVEEPTTGKNLIEQDRNRLKNRLTKLLQNKQTTTEIIDGTYVVPGVQIDSDNQGWYYTEYRFKYNKDGKNYFEKNKVYVDKKIPVSTVSFKEGKVFTSLSEQPIEAKESKKSTIEEPSSPKIKVTKIVNGEIVEEQIENNEDEDTQSGNMVRIVNGEIAESNPKVTRIVNGEIVEEETTPKMTRIVNGEIVEEGQANRVQSQEENIIKFMEGKEDMRELFNVLSGAIKLNQIQIVC